MPIPLSIGFWAMNAVRKYHSAPAFERPIHLQRVYLARVFCYCSFAVITGSMVLLKTPISKTAQS